MVKYEIFYVYFFCGQLMFFILIGKGGKYINCFKCKENGGQIEKGVIYLKIISDKYNGRKSLYMNF